MKENKDMPEEWHWLRRFFLITVFGFWAFLSSNFALMHHMAILVISTFSLCAFIYLLIRKRYSKSFRLVFSFFLLICVFPMTYYFIYLNDNNSFNYEESILKLNKKYITQVDCYSREKFRMKSIRFFSNGQNSRKFSTRNIQPTLIRY